MFDAFEDTILLCVKIGTCLRVSGLDKLSDALIDQVTHCEQGETGTMGVTCRYIQYLISNIFLKNGVACSISMIIFVEILS